MTGQKKQQLVHKAVGLLLVRKYCNHCIIMP